MAFPIVWFHTQTARGGIYTWVLPNENRPEFCFCGASLAISDWNGARDEPIELECAGGHKWISVIYDLERRLHR